MLKPSAIAIVSVLLLAGHASAQLDTRVDFTPADNTRTHMDVAGAWNGVSDQTLVGDRFSITLENSDATETIFDLGLTATLPAGFNERTASLNVAVSGAGSCGVAPGVSVVRSGNDLEFDFGGYDLPALCELTLDFGLVAPAGTSSGTYNVAIAAEGASVDLGTVDFIDSSNTSFQVLNGAVILEKTPAVTQAKVGDTISWTISARNSGLGGLFDLTLDESALAGQAGLTLSGITSVSPGAPAATIGADSISLPYLAPGETFSATVDASVAACEGLTNTVAFAERTGLFNDDQDASVQLELDTPEISYSIASTPVPYNGTGTFTIDIDNTGTGDAASFSLDTSLNSQPLEVVSVSPGWSYNSGTGEVTFTAGIIPAGSSETLVITVQDDANKCSVVGSATATFKADFEDDCGTAFQTPADLASISFANVPSINIADGFDPRLETNQSGSFLITVSATDANSLDTDPVVVNYTLPAAIQDGALLTPSVGTTTCSGACGAGSVVTWSVPRADLNASQTLQVGITTSALPCDAGQSYNETASVSTTFGGGVCSISDSESRGFLLSNNTFFAATQRFNQTGSPFETGDPDNGDAVRVEGEGEQAGFEAEYGFDPADPGIWTGSTYEDDFGGLAGVTLNQSTLEYNLNNTGWASVPGASVSGGTGSFTVALDFLVAIDGADAVAGDSLQFRYNATAPDSVLGGAISRRVDQFSRLTVKTGLQNQTSCPAGSDAVYSQGDRVTWQRANGEIAVTLNDNIVDVCEVLDARITLNNENNAFPIRNLLATLGLGSDYELVTPSNPTYTGSLGGGASVTYNSADPSVTLNEETMAGQSTATIQIRRRATSNQQGGGITARMDYDDNETAPAGARVFNDVASDAPLLVNSAQLDIFVAPNTLPSTTDIVSWVITVRNTQAGMAFNSQISDIVPSGLTISAANVTAMNAANAFTVNSTPTTVSWDVGDIAPGGTVKLTIFATVDGSTCSIPAGSNLINAQWGCGGFLAQTAVNTRPDITFPSGRLEIIHDTTGAYAELCGAGQIIVIARNSGISEVIDVEVQEALNSASTGITMVPGSAEYSTNGGASWTPAVGVAATSTLTFDQTSVPPLAVLAGNGNPGDEVLIRFGINTTAQTNSDAGVTASGSGALHCGDTVNSPGSAFTVPVDKPRMRVTKTGRNTTTGAAIGENIFAAPGDTIEWTATVQNQGEIATNELRIRDILAGSNGAATISGPGISQTVTADYVAITEIAAGASATYTITEILGSSCVTAPNTADVTWGCIAQPVGDPSELSTPIDNTDSAQLIMIPQSTRIDINQTVTDAAGTGGLTTEGRVTLEITNNGAPFTAGVITNTLPTGFRYDPSFTPIVTNTDTGSDGYDAVAIDASDVTAPVLTFSRGGSAGYLRNGETLTVEFAIYQDGSLDTAGDPAIREEDVGSSDPAIPADSTNTVALAYESGCGIAGSKSDTLNVAPKTPDLDIDIANPISRIVTGTGATETYSVQVTNNGDTAANDATLTITIGAGWSGSTPAGCTGSIPGALTCDLSGASAIGMGASRDFALNLTVANETSPLTVEAQVEGNIQDAANGDTGGNYSFDQIEAQTLGFRQTLMLQSTSETDFAAAEDLQIGEEAVLRIESVWFGAGTATITDPEVSLNFERLTGFSRISEIVTTAQPIANQTNFGAGAPNDVVYEFADFTGGDTVIIDVTVRALNNAANSSGTEFDFISSASSVFNGFTFDDTATGFPVEAGRTETLTYERPLLTAVKEVRNVTLTGTFAAAAEGDASDVFEYRIVLENTGTAPAFDLSITDTVPDGFTITPFATDTIDNDDDGASDEAAEGSIAGQVITFNRTTTDEGKLAALPVGQTLTLTYQTIANATVKPSEANINTADYLFDTLDGASGSQTAPIGANNDPNGAFEDGDTVTATVTIAAVDLTKSLIVTSVGGDTSTDVVVGEQADFELSIVLPAGTVEDFIIEDFLPEGLALVSRDAIVYGTGVTCPTTSTLPATLPASGAPLTASWDLGTCTITPVAESDRTVTIAYTAQVENIAAVEDTDTLENAAQYNHSEVADPVVAVPVELTVIEPRLTLTLVATPDTNLDAGDTVTATYVLSNTGTAPAFNVDLPTLVNDNGVDDGTDGDVDTASAYGDAARDVQALSCLAADVNDISGTLGDFLFSFDDGDGDNDTNNEAADCRALYRNVSTDGFGAGDSLTFTTTFVTDANIVTNTSYILAALAEATSLPTSAPGFGDSDYERSAASDASTSGRYAATATDIFATRNTPGTQKTFLATTDVNTTPDSGTAVDVAIGETYTAEITYRFDEGLTRRVLLRERVRLDGPNTVGEVELVQARLRRTNTGLTSETDPSGINSAAVGVSVDVTSLMTEGVSANYKTFTLDMGEVAHAGTASAFNTGRDIESFVIEYDMRVRDVTANQDGLVLRDQGQTRRHDGDNQSRGFTGGQTRFATIVEPEFTVTKTSADADGILSGNETVTYTLIATNNGTGPAYNTVLEDTLPPALRTAGLSGVGILIDGSAPSAAPVFSYNSATGLARWTFANADVVLPGADIQITYTATADASVAPGSVHTNAFEVAAYYSQDTTRPDDRRQLQRSNIASVTLGAPEIAFIPDQTSSTQPGSTVIYPHILQVPSSLASGTLSFASTSSRGQGWQVWYDADGDGTLSGGDARWNNGDTLPATGDLQFFVQTQVPNNAHDGWRDVTTTTATVSLGGTNLSGQVTDITTVSRLQAGELTAGKFMAIDRDCDGSLADETAADATFEDAKGAAPGECVIYRITFRNEGTGTVTNIDVRDVTPAFTVYIGGSATYETTPATLTPGTAATPSANDNGPLSFPYGGSLPAGEEGAVTYGVRVGD
jgi:uncharacterized repeat protein (TIGR01451 family)/fimbrial isopeptide formation D2 family protein